jgi:predicted DNA-binding transcriptional regulator AlpA
MGAAETIPFEHRAIGAEEVGQLFGLSARTALETIVCKPTFPKRISNKPAAWIAGEVLAWRDANRVSPRGRRPRSGSRSAANVDHDGR